MFRRELYRAMAPVLDAFDAEALERFSFRFAGGVRLALEHDEFRVSADLDFLCADAGGYRDLRLATRAHGYRALFTEAALATLVLPREMRSDQYGIRFPVVLAERTIRVELIREARVALGPPAHLPWTGVPCLSIDDCVLEKLLANSDRAADRDVLGRDLVDLAVLREAHGPLPPAALREAERAYGASVREDLRKAARGFLADDTFRERCFSGLAVEASFRPRILAGVSALLAEV